MSSVSCSNLGEINYMFLGSQVRNSAHLLTHLLTRVKSRDASASKKVPVFRTKFYKNEPIFRIGHTGGPIEVEDSVVYYFDYLALSNFQ